MSYTIRPAVEDDFDAFFVYVNDHLSDNGVNGAPLFMPMARAESTFGEERVVAFRRALVTPFGQPGWRKLWLAVNEDGSFAAHADLRARPEPPAAHRTLLGMGVHRDHRQQGLGRRMLDTVHAWAVAQPALEWIDLDVLATNTPAQRLYQRAGFTETGRIADMFRIDGESVGHIMMEKRLR